jgi:hypothetical protein
MPSPLRNPKTLSQWFELDYFRRRRLFRRLWRSLPVLALLVSCLGVGWTFWAGKQTVYQAGPLATAHASFHHDCGKCHTEAFPGWNRLWTSDAAVPAVPDSACQQCHAGPLHHSCVAQRNCASCHHEHRGHAALARVADSQCTSCHADLTCDNGKTPSFAAHVTGFTEGKHPEFRLWREGTPTDPGTIEFSHKKHLGPLRDPKDCEEKVRLDCHSCHEMDEAGRYMRPIHYDRHCIKCHPLSVQLVGDGKADLGEAARAFRAEPALHPSVDETAETVRAVLRERLTRFIRNPENKTFLGADTPSLPPRPLPGWQRVEPVPPQEYAWVNKQLEQVERVLFDGAGGCRHCHQEKTDAARRPGGLPVYRRSGLLNVWYEHSVFSHLSHKALDCGQCHANVSASTEASDVLMPRLETCQRCHNERREVSARSDCVECHSYHDPKLKRQFKGDQTIEQLIGK